MQFIEKNCCFIDFNIYSLGKCATPQKSTVMNACKITLLLCLFTIVSFGTISTKEKSALIAFYNATEGTNWSNTWELESPVSSWYGVVINNDKVVELNLPFNNLKGSLPSELGDLIHLQNLWLNWWRLRFLLKDFL